MRQELISVYGLVVAVSDYVEVIQRHKLACAEHSRNPTPEKTTGKLGSGLIGRGPLQRVF